MFKAIKKILLPLSNVFILCVLIMKALPLSVTAIDSPQALPLNIPSYKIIDGRKYILVNGESQLPFVVEDPIPGAVILPCSYPYNYVVCHHFPCIIGSNNGRYYYKWGGRYNPVYYSQDEEKYFLEGDPNTYDEATPVCVIRGMPGPITLPIDYANNYILCRSFRCPIELRGDQPCYQWGPRYYPIYFR